MRDQRIRVLPSREQTADDFADLHAVIAALTLEVYVSGQSAERALSRPAAEAHLRWLAGELRRVLTLSEARGVTAELALRADPARPALRLLP